MPPVGSPPSEPPWGEPVGAGGRMMMCVPPPPCREVGPLPMTQIGLTLAFVSTGSPATMLTAGPPSVVGVQSGGVGLPSVPEPVPPWVPVP